MFGWGKKKEAGAGAKSGGVSGPSGEEGEPIIAALLMEREKVDLGALVKKIRGGTFGGRRADDVKEDGGIVSFQLGDEVVALAPMPAPYPWSDLEGPCETSWMWPKGMSAMSVKGHRSHVLVTAIGGKGNPIERRLALTQVTALAAQEAGVMGVYWGEGTMVHYPVLFAKMAEKMTSVERPPLYLWVDFRVMRNADGSSAMFTTGLRALGLMEVEIPRMGMGPGELREWSVNVAGYLLTNGSKVKDGDTIGVSESQRIRVRHAKSVFGIKGDVMRLEETG